VFQMMPVLFKPEKAGSWEAVIRYEVFGRGGGVWTIVVKEGRMEVVKGPGPAPTVTFKVHAPTFRRIVTRELDGLTAINSGLMQIEGNQADAALFYEALGTAG
jgi:hypothetical protein